MTLLLFLLKTAFHTKPQSKYVFRYCVGGRGSNRGDCKIQKLPWDRQQKWKIQKPRRLLPYLKNKNFEKRSPVITLWRGGGATVGGGWSKRKTCFRISTYNLECFLLFWGLCERGLSILCENRLREKSCFSGKCFYLNRLFQTPRKCRVTHFEIFKKSF